MGTLYGGFADAVPTVVNQIIPRAIPPEVLTHVLSAQVIVIDLLHTDMEEVEFLYQAIKARDFQTSAGGAPTTVVLITTAGTWGKTPCQAGAGGQAGESSGSGSSGSQLEEDGEFYGELRTRWEARRAKAAAAAAAAKRRARAAAGEGSEGDAADGAGEGDGDGDGDEGSSAAEERKSPAQAALAIRDLHHVQPEPSLHTQIC